MHEMCIVGTQKGLIIFFELGLNPTSTSSMSYAVAEKSPIHFLEFSPALGAVIIIRPAHPDESASAKLVDIKTLADASDEISLASADKITFVRVFERIPQVAYDADGECLWVSRVAPSGC